MYAHTIHMIFSVFHYHSSTLRVISRLETIDVSNKTYIINLITAAETTTKKILLSHAFPILSE